MGINIVLLIVAALFFSIGICISELKWYWLISGYNIISKEEKANVEIKALGNHISKIFFFISSLNIVGFLLNYFFNISLAIFIVLNVIVILYSIYYCQRFDHNPNSSKETKIVLVIVIFIMLITCIPIMAIGYSSTKVTITDTSIKISSGVNALIPKDKIKSISLVNEMPKTLIRTGGIGMGGIQKGNYSLYNDIKAKLFLASKEGPFIEIILDSSPSHYYINYKDSKNTKTTYEDIINKLDLDK
ncbi:DUF3784 domain-containing protein [Clostridium sp. UBA7503]|uniref:DUF3784 domain-containing protein n=1 Tax=Clostridium sp. UBA7503 TaxID=1946377 RepID=UPI003217BC2D